MYLDDCAIIPSTQESGICYYDGKLTISRQKNGVTFQLRNIDKSLSYVNIVRFVLDKTVLGLPKYTKSGTFSCLHYKIYELSFLIKKNPIMEDYYCHFFDCDATP